MSQSVLESELELVYISTLSHHKKELRGLA